MLSASTPALSISLNEAFRPIILSQFSRMDLKSSWEIDEAGLVSETVDRSLRSGLSLVNANQQFDVFGLITLLNKPQQMNLVTHLKAPCALDLAGL